MGSQYKPPLSVAEVTHVLNVGAEVSNPSVTIKAIIRCLKNHDMRIHHLTFKPNNIEELYYLVKALASPFVLYDGDSMTDITVFEWIMAEMYKKAHVKFLFPEKTDLNDPRIAESIAWVNAAGKACERKVVWEVEEPYEEEE